MPLRELSALVWKRRVVVAVVFVLCILAAAIYAYTEPKRYESTVTIAFTPNPTQGQFIPSENLSALLSTYAAVAKSDQNRAGAATILGHPVTGTISTSTGAGSGILELIDEDTNAKRAAKTVTAIALAFVHSITSNTLVVPTIVNPAVASNTPVQPRPGLIISVAAVLGLIAGVMLALVLEHLRPTAETTSELTELTGLPVIGRFARERALTSGTSLVWGSDRLYHAQEAYRTLRTNVELLFEEQPTVIQITSAGPSQGKSTVVANLAIALGQLDIQTTIVDADLRKPRQHEIFELGNEVGLSTAMLLPKGEIAPQATAFEKVSVLTSGPIVSNAPEMLALRFRSILTELKQRGGVVLVDSAPVLPVSDSRLIARHSDAVLFVIAAGRTRTSAIPSSLEKLRFAHANVIGLVLNFAYRDDDSSERYSYGYGYGYEDPQATQPVPTV